MSPPNRSRDTAGELEHPEPDPERVADAVARLATYRDEPEPDPEPDPEPEPDHVPVPRSAGNTRKPYAGELAEVRRAARAHQAAREKLYEAMRRARALKPRPSIREVAAAAGLSHAHVHREVG